MAEREDKVSLEFCRQACEYGKTALYAAFLLNGGAATALIAKFEPREIPCAIFIFVFGLIMALVANASAFWACVVASKFPFEYPDANLDFSFSIPFRNYVHASLILTIISVISFLIGCVWIWQTI